MEIDGFNGTEAELHRLRAEAILNADNVTSNSHGGSRDELDGVNKGVIGSEELPDIDNPAHTKQDVNVGLPMSCDPPGPNNPVRQLVWIVSKSLTQSHIPDNTTLPPCILLSTLSLNDSYQYELHH